MLSVLQAFVAKLMTLFGGVVIQKILKCIPAIVASVEQAMLDKKITADERKNIAMAAVDAIGEQFGYKVTGILRWAISMLIDAISKKLPSKDIAVPSIITKIVSAPN